MAPEISVVVPTFNRAAVLAHALEALARQTLEAGRFEVIVVDDASTDETPALLRRFAEGRLPLQVLRLPANRGRGAARNAGIQTARGRYISFVDSDIVVGPEFLRWHLKTLAAHGGGVLSRGPVVLISDLRDLPAARAPRLAASPAYLDTANAMLPKAALQEAGLFDEGFPGYGWEDFELGVRLRRLGLRRVFCPQAVAFHIQPVADAALLPELLAREEERARSAVYFWRKHPTPQTRWLIQATPLHGAVYWLAALGGALDPARALQLARRLERRGRRGLAHVVVRGVLNLHYYRALTSALHRHAAALA
ncbi:MAG: glycosyltransferase [Armatimonadota bacterium]|nr:glycosyltransferase [Armatimonadota bacterium]MDR7452011.1 glycosyltransferase [Armatimonadota bacterium]MDR7467902.1 glycosyltransferase [Armatimonadota bacterium]MDR7494245.1 glycosyltransferase [Armatimonadota bacterium]MDR7500026.1 glycosyltransferase [Armatimonadota bacterium]